jgi:hypothetical protein
MSYTTENILSAPSSTNAMFNPFMGGGASPVTFTNGPTWKSFEDFRKSGTAALQSVPQRGIATLRTKAGTFRILHDADFQRLLGLASDIYRMQNGLRIVIKVAKITVKHPDKEHIDLLLQSASMLTECPVLPERTGHEEFQLSPEEEAEHSSDDLDLDKDIQRPEF